MSTTVSALYKTRVSLSNAAKQVSINRLNVAVASVVDLHAQTKHAHWNVKGPSFRSLHLLFDDQAQILPGFSDLMAERAVLLGGVAKGTLPDALSASVIDKFPSNVATMSDMEILARIADGFGTVGAYCRDSIQATAEAGDECTADLFTEVTRGLDRATWFLEAHLQDKPAEVDN